MRTLKSLLAPTMLALALYPAPGQSTFQNLDFESATLIPIPGDPYGSVQFVAAFPGWTGYIGTNQVSAALYNRALLDSSGIAIIDSGWQHDLGAAAGVIEGSYSAILQAGVVGTITNPQDTRLSQTGLVPAGAQSLRFKAYDPTLLPPHSA